MKIKSVYICPDEMTTQDFLNFREKDIEKFNLSPRDVFMDRDIESAMKQDVAKGLYGWDAVRILDPKHGETFIIEINGILNFYHKFND